MKNILSLLHIVALLFILSACNSNKKAEKVKNTKKPNVVFILVDDLGLHDLSSMGSSYYETPNIDRIAKAGFVFTQGYAASRVCSPSRASIMTGKFTARHGITNWIGEASGTAWRKKKRNDKLLPAEYLHNLPEKDTTLAEAMRYNGYCTFLAGKWHLGSEGHYPEDNGFDINKGGWSVGLPVGGYFSPWKNPKLPNEKKGENLSLRLAKETVKFIEQHKDSTFFAYLSFYAVHGEIQSTQKKWSKYRDKAVKKGVADHGYKMERVLPIRTQQDNPVYGGLVEQMDDAVGIVLDELKKLGLDKNTIVIFTSDNGGVASGDSFSTSNLPLRGGKGNQWEGGTRVPFFIDVPWLHGNGTKINTPVMGTDFYPTILNLANLPLLPDQHKDGKSLKPLLEGKTIADRPLFWHYPHYGNQGGEPASMVRDKDWKLIYYWEDGREELYNLSADKGEQNDVAKENPDIVSRLNKELMAFLDETHAKKPEKDPEYDPVLAKKLHQVKIDVLMPKLEKERKEMLSKDFEPNNDWWGSKVTKD